MMVDLLAGLHDDSIKSRKQKRVVANHSLAKGSVALGSAGLILLD